MKPLSKHITPIASYTYSYPNPVVSLNIPGNILNLYSILLLPYTYLVACLEHFLFSIYREQSSQLTDMFQRVWNHQPDDQVNGNYVVSAPFSDISMSESTRHIQKWLNAPWTFVHPVYALVTTVSQKTLMIFRCSWRMQTILQFHVIDTVDGRIPAPVDTVGGWSNYL